MIQRHPYSNFPPVVSVCSGTGSLSFLSCEERAGVLPAIIQYVPHIRWSQGDENNEIAKVEEKHMAATKKKTKSASGRTAMGKSMQSHRKVQKKTTTKKKKVVKKRKAA